MAISYNKLWKLLIDKNLNKTKLRTEAGISSNAMAKLGKNMDIYWGVRLLGQEITFSKWILQTQN